MCQSARSVRFPLLRKEKKKKKKPHVLLGKKSSVLQQFCKGRAEKNKTRFPPVMPLAFPSFFEQKSKTINFPPVKKISKFNSVKSETNSK